LSLQQLGNYNPSQGRGGHEESPSPASLGILLVWELRGALHIPKAETSLLMSLKKFVYPLHRAPKKPFCHGAGRSQLPVLSS